MKTLEQLLSNDTDLSNHLDNMWKTRAGLMQIIETRPELKKVILPQFETLNNIIGAIIKDKPYHPNLGFY
ncbi:hypothetical protein [Leeuwenhoekiella marinoflava]|uniref:hypothetical protein n=1 Tax=Leeuwenhoekiella marinoflava TaxID=988 RepID=UPI003002BA1D